MACTKKSFVIVNEQNDGLEIGRKWNKWNELLSKQLPVPTLPSSLANFNQSQTHQLSP